jgi:hypothetical protein
MSRKPQPATLTSNSFAALASDYDEEVLEPKPSPPFRVWSLDEAEKRFKNDTNIFSSPFARKKWSKPRFKEDWVSIEVGKAEEETEVDTQEFPSMLSRGDQERAVLWAEKVKKSLERAEKVRVEFKRGKDTSCDIGTRLSFFRSGTLGIDKHE